MSGKDEVFLNHPTGGEDYSTREAAENADVASLQRELSEQRRIGDAQQSPFDHNRVPTPGSGDGAGGRVRRTNWPK
jgi:hypothetical protein